MQIHPPASIEAVMLEYIFDSIFILAGAFFLLAVLYVYGFLYISDLMVIRSLKKKTDYKDK